MFGTVEREQEVRRLGRDYGHELAAALLLASRQPGADRALTRQMTQIVLREIDAAVLKLRNAAFPAELTAIYERGAKQGVRDVLLKSRAVAAADVNRAA
jgi:hypothetical protein